MPDPFPSTRWSLVSRARHPQDAVSREALSELCGLYWFPLYAFVRRHGHAPEEAADLVQAYFVQLLRKALIHVPTRGDGRFRSFLLHTCRQFLADERERAAARKRGGGMQVVSLDREDAETRYGAALATTTTPEKEFDRSWATTTVDRVVAAIGREFESRGKRPEFRQLRGFLTDGTGRGSYEDVADRLGLTESAVKSTVYRMRRRFAEILRREIAETVADPADVDDEIRYLFAALE